MNVYLKFPSIYDKDNWIDYVNEYCFDKPSAKPLGYAKDSDYELWLSNIINEHEGINLRDGRVPSSSYFLMSNDKIVGNLSIRHNINSPFLSQYGGHIGYGVRPSERRKGYGTLMLNLALEKCVELGIEDVLISCKEDNIGSAKVIENNGGILSEIIFIPEENCNFKKYLINVEKVVNKKHK